MKGDDEMTAEVMFYSKLYNELIDRLGIEPDKYEREDAFFGICNMVYKGMELKDACIDVFNSVHGYDLTDDMYESCYANVKGVG